MAQKSHISASGGAFWLVQWKVFYILAFWLF